MKFTCSGRLAAQQVKDPHNSATTAAVKHLGKIRLKMKHVVVLLGLYLDLSAAAAAAAASLLLLFS